jgi:superfamily II DNA or RNA helicase
MLTTLRPYQEEVLNKIKDQLANTSKVCLAASCGSGKTNIAIAFIERFLEDNKGAKVLVLTHGQVLLRNQFISRCQEVQPSFVPGEVVKSKDLLSIYNTHDVIVLIPQSLKNLSNLPKFDLIVVDEGHQFFFAKGKGKGGMVEQIIRKTGVTKQLALTGTPSPYVKNKWPIISIPMNTLLPKYIEDVVVELAASSYLVKFEDYDLKKGELKEEKQKSILTMTATNQTLDNLLAFIFKRAKMIWRHHPTIANVLINGKPDWIVAFKNLQKTMIACKSQDQARDVKTYFESKGIKTLISISDDQDAKEAQAAFDKFKSDPNALILIVVGRGVLGFDYSELANVIDMTCSSNIDRIFQLMSRLVRKSDKVKQKLFLKIAPDLFPHHKGQDYFHHVMVAVLSLTDEYWFTQFNGKNFLQLKIPKVAAIKTGNRKSNGKHQKSKQAPIVKSWLGLPAVEFFKGLWHKNEKGTYSYEFTTLGRVRKELLGKGYQDIDAKINALLKAAKLVGSGKLEWK